eukprot:SAG31_NODE_189_length_20842_cov_12.518151_15_plen_258_part_00
MEDRDFTLELTALSSAYSACDDDGDGFLSNGAELECAFAAHQQTGTPTDALNVGLVKWIMVGLSRVLEEGGLPAYAGFLAFFVLWVLLTLPTTPLEIVAAYVYGFPLGAATGAIGKTVGSTAGFLLGRVAGQRLGWEMPSALKEYWKTFDKAPLTCLLAIRAAPLPLGMKNYGLSITPCPLWLFFVATGMVNIPFSIMWAATGSQAGNIVDALDSAGKGGISFHQIVIGVVLLLLAIIIYKTLLAKHSSTTKVCFKQ